EQAGWTRRRFMKTAALAGAAGAVSGALPLPVRALTATGFGPSPRIAIVGGGIAGLNAAYQLKKAGIGAMVYEARRRLGGRILSITRAIGEGLVTDLGGELINSDHEDMLHLVQEFDLELFNRIEDAERFAFPTTGYFFDGVARSEAEVAGDLRALAAQIASDSERLDADFECFAPKLDRLSAKGYLDRHAGLIPQAYIRTLIEGSIRTEYGVEPEDSSALQLICNLPTVDGQAVEVLGNSDEVFVVKGGTGEIIESLAQQLDGRIRTHSQLSRIDAREDGFRLLFASGETVAADFVILTIPFPVLRDVVLDVPLPKRLRRFIGEFELGRNEKLIAGFDERAWWQPEGFVAEAWTDLGYAEVWDETQRQPERADGALTFFLGGREVAVLAEGSARSIGRTFVQRLDGITPGVEAASTDKFLRTRWSQSRFTRGAYANFKPGQLTRFGGLLWIESEDTEERQEVHAGNLVFAGEHLSDAFYGFMNGAAETGRLAADFVVRRIAELTVASRREPESRVA
ncbi:MAG: flavin monoamine oxidase family protein, partial [Methylococcales bacterium]